MDWATDRMSSAELGLFLVNRPFSQDEIYCKGDNLYYDYAIAIACLYGRQVVVFEYAAISSPQ